MEDHSKDNAFKRLLHFKRSQKHRARPNNPTPHGAGHPFPAPSPSSFGPYFEASDARSRSITPTRASLRDVEKRGSPLRRGISPTSSKRRTGFKSLYETANSHCISLFQQLELCKADYIATDSELNKEREASYLLNQRLEAAQDAQRQIIADRESQEQIAMGLSNELEKEKLRLSEARAQLAALNRDKSDAQRKYSSLKDAYRSQRVALGETSNIVKDLETKVYERQRQLDAMGVLQDELAKARTESEANRRERHQLRKQVDRNDKQVNELQEQLTYARSHLAALEGENAKVAQALAAAHELRLTAEDRLKTAEDSLQQTLQESSEAQTALEAQLREVRERYDETNDRAEELASQLGQAQETTIDLQSRLDQAESTLSESQQLVDSLQNDISELRSSNTTLEGDLDDLRQHAENAAAAHLDRMTSMEADLRMSQSAHDATASARDSAVAQLEELSQKNLHIAQQLREFEDSSHRLRLDLEDARNSGSQMSSTISGLRETVEQLDQARTEVVNQAIAEAAEHQNRIHDLEAKLSSAEEEAQQSRSTTQQQLEALKSMNDELAEKLVDLKETRNQHAAAMRTRVAELSAQIQTAASLHDRLALEKQSLESSVAELKSTVETQAAHLTTAQQDVTMVQVDLEAARQDLRSVSSERDDLKAELSRQTEVMRETDMAVRTLRGALSTARTSCNTLQDRIRTLTHQALNERRRRQEAEAETQRLREREEALVAELRRLPAMESENTTLHQKLQDIQNELECSRSSIQDLSKDLTATKQALSEARAEIEANQEALIDYGQTKEQVIHLTEERHHLEARINQLEATNTELNAELQARQAEREELRTARARIEQQERALSGLGENLRAATESLEDLQANFEKERSERARVGNELFILENERDELSSQIGRFKEKVRGLEDKLRRAEAGADYSSLLILSRRILEGCQALSDGHSPSKPRNDVTVGVTNGRAALGELNNNLDLIFKYMNYFEVDHLRKQRGRHLGTTSSYGSPEGTIEPSTPRMPTRGFEHAYFKDMGPPPLSPAPGRSPHYFGTGWNPLLAPFSPAAGTSRDPHELTPPPPGWGFGGSRPA